MLYPQQNTHRNVVDLSGLWRFKLDPDDRGETEGWYGGVSGGRTVAVPASWNEQFEDTRDYLGAAWYALETYVPRGWQGERVYLRVGSANYAANVWVNGERVGEHEGGHLPFACELTNVLHWDAPNLVVIRVDNALTPTRVPPGNLEGGLMAGFMGSYPNASFDFFPYAGLHRPVLLCSTPQTAIQDVTVVTDIAPDGTGKVSISVQAEGATQGRLSLTGEGDPTETALEFSGGVADAELSVPEPRLWSPADPYLYRLTLELSEAGETLDRYDLDIGIRTVEVRENALLLNGEKVFLKGFGKHEDFPIHGRGLNLPLLVRDHSLLRWVGANSYRTAHYPYSEEAMLMADREGILIIDETPAVGLFFEDGPDNIGARLEQCKRSLAELIARDKNHPSVILWSVANEPMPPDLMARFRGAEVPPTDPATTDFFRTLFDLGRSLDPTRPLTLAGLHGCPNEWLALADVVMINRYYGWYMLQGRIDEAKTVLEGELDTLHSELGKPIIVSEFGADTVAGAHSNPPEMFTEEYQRDFLRAYLDAAEDRDFVIGMHVWNFADFKTGQGTFRVGGLNLKGVFTRDRKPKLAAHYLRERWLEASGDDT